MKKSKLEFYEDILCTLASKPLTLDDLAFSCNMNCVTLQQRLEFLIQNDIVSIEINHENATFYFLSRRGESISKTFRLIKRLKRLQTNEKTVHRMQTISPFSDSTRQKTRRLW